MAPRKKILVTGATGFLGSHLVKHWLSKGHEIVALKRSTSDARRIAAVAEHLALYDVDRVDTDAVLRDHPAINAIVHTATCYGRHGESAQRVGETNLVFPVTVLEAAIRHQVPLYINTDTALPKYTNAYALSKKQFREWGRFFALQDAIRFVNVQLQHIFGPGDDASKFTTYVIRGCLENIPQLALTAGEQRRDFMYVDDAVAGYDVLLESLPSEGGSFQEYDLGMGDAVSIREFALTVKRATGSTTHLAFGAVPYRPNEVADIHADTTAIRNLGWRWHTSLEAGIRKTVEIEKAR